MFRLNNIKQNVLILSFATLLAGCGGGETNTPTDSMTLETGINEKVESVTTNIIHVTESSATIDITEWIAQDYTVTEVQYGTTNYDSTLIVNIVNNETTITLDNLEPDTTYYYKIVAHDNNGKTIVSSNNIKSNNNYYFITTSTVSDTNEIDTTLTTDTNITDPISVAINNPPEAQNVMIIGTPKVGNTLTLDYTFTDIDGDTEGGSIIAWSTPTVEVQRGTSKTFTIPAELAGEQLSAWVHPSDGIVVTTNGIQAENGYITIEAATLIVEPTPEAQDPVCTSGPAMQQGQIKDSLSGIGLVDVTISIAGCSTKTDVNGYYTLQNIAVNEDAVVNFEKEGYLLGSTHIQIKELSGDNTSSTNYLEYAIDPYDYQWSYDSQTGYTDAHIDIPASVYTDNVGKLYTGIVSAVLEIQDVTTDAGKALFPGSFEGQNSNGMIQQFVSHGLISLLFKDSNGNQLNFSDGTIATLTFDAVASMEGQNIIPLWYYDYNQGLWIEEGYAVLQIDGTYKGEISHPGTWSLNQPIEKDPGMYRGRILYEDGTPARDVRISAIGKNWVTTDLSTDIDGIFEIEVIPGNTFQLTAYNYKDKYEAKYNGIISAIASGDIVEDRM